MVTKIDYGRTPENICQAFPPSSPDLYRVRLSKDGKDKRLKTSRWMTPLKVTGNGYIRADGKTTRTMKSTRKSGRSSVQKEKSE